MAKFNSMQSNSIAINFPHGCSPVNLLHIFRIPFPTNTSRGLLLSQGKTYEQQKVYINISINNTMSLSLHIEMREYNKFKFCYDLHDNYLLEKLNLKSNFQSGRDGDKVKKKGYTPPFGWRKFVDLGKENFSTLYINRCILLIKNVFIAKEEKSKKGQFSSWFKTGDLCSCASLPGPGGPVFLMPFYAMLVFSANF